MLPAKTVCYCRRGADFARVPMQRVALVVDDSMLIRHTVCRFLEARGFAVESATHGQEALEIMKRVTPHLIITDMQMPTMTGAELIAAVKGNPATASIPIVVVAGKDSCAGMKPVEANVTIFKDIDITEQLGKALDSVFHAKKARKQAATQ